MRLFVAINLPADTRHGIYGATAPLRSAAPDLAWVPEARLHLTLKFLGEIQDARVDDYRLALGAVTARHATLDMQLEGVGAFPNFRRARTVWLGVTSQPRLELLQHDVELAFAELGCDVEGRPFRPHLTLARVKHPDAAALRALAAASRKVRYSEEVIVESVDLMQSELVATGAKYTPLLAASLRSR